jgi:hypothetical protein
VPASIPDSATKLSVSRDFFCHATRILSRQRLI